VPWASPVSSVSGSQQQAAAERTLIHVQAAYEQVTEPILVSLAVLTPGAQTKRRYAQHVQQAAPQHAESIRNDRAWDALATVLAEGKAAGHNASSLFNQAFSQRPLDDARSPARALTWRIRRLGQRQAPSPQAQAANARHARHRPTASVSPLSPEPKRQQRR
jgi:hypothetical protein